MQTKQLSYLLEIAQQQSLSAASKILHISQPALSQYLSNLEKELGFPLFFSYQRKLFPTSEGSIYLNAAKKIVEVKEHTYQKIASLCQPSEIQQITVGVSGYTSSRLIGRIIPEIYQKFPYAEILVKEGFNQQLHEYLGKKEVHMAILSLKENQKKANYFFQFSRHELFLLIPKIYGISTGEALWDNDFSLIQLESLKDIPFLLPGEETAQWEILEKLFQKAGYIPTTLYTSNNLFVMLQLAQAGFGACFLSSHLIHQINTSAMQIFRLPEQPCLSYGVAVRKDQPISLTEQYLIYCILKQGMKGYIPNFVMNGLSKTLFDQWEETTYEHKTN